MRSNYRVCDHFLLFILLVANLSDRWFGMWWRIHEASSGQQEATR